MHPSNVIALDIGTVRIGVARANTTVRIPELLPTLANTDDFVEKLRALIDEYAVEALIVGLPRNMQGEETAQTAYVREFAATHLSPLGLPVILQDETLSSVAAEQALNASKKRHEKADIDAYAAGIIVSDYLETV
jgi:putative holliday junction resolvase